jgi:hypothetical protein
MTFFDAIKIDTSMRVGLWQGDRSKHLQQALKKQQQL